MHGSAWQCQPAGHSPLFVQSSVVPQVKSLEQNSFPSVSVRQKHSGETLQSSKHGHRAYWANAGVRRLDSTGADQATAAPAPIRFSILRREMRFGLMSPSIRLVTSFVLGCHLCSLLAHPGPHPQAISSPTR